MVLRVLGFKGFSFLEKEIAQCGIGLANNSHPFKVQKYKTIKIGPTMVPIGFEGRKRIKRVSIK